VAWHPAWPDLMGHAVTYAGDNDLPIPPALAAQSVAAAEDEHRPAAVLVRDALEHHLASLRTAVRDQPGRRTPAEAAARLRKMRKGNTLPAGVTI
jgi:hypothetical protein